MTEVLTEGLIGQKLGKPFMKEVLDKKKKACNTQTKIQYLLEYFREIRFATNCWVR